jgi:hypothetical protein
MPSYLIPLILCCIRPLLLLHTTVVRGAVRTYKTVLNSGRVCQVCPFVRYASSLFRCLWADTLAIHLVLYILTLYT